MKQSCRPVSFLASVTSESEARLCASLGADIIDAKDPAAGALGALPGPTVRAIRARVPQNIPVSATIGDPSGDPAAVADAVRFMAATGVDFVKIGFAPDAAHMETLQRLSALDLGSARLVAVLLADNGVDLGMIAHLSDCGFAGVMLDTNDKQAGPLPGRVPAETLRAFVDGARAAGLFAGLAGSLAAEHVAYLKSFEPDVLGFRGGLCHLGVRADAIDAEAVNAVRRAIDDNDESAAACGTPQGDAIARRQPEGAI
jgi:(5-formylfuran-3-yl)methyl phosphate synthase